MNVLLTGAGMDRRSLPRAVSEDGDFFDKEMVGASTADPMSLWPGPSHPAEYEFGYSTIEGHVNSDDKVTPKPLAKFSSVCGNPKF